MPRTKKVPKDDPVARMKRDMSMMRGFVDELIEESINTRRRIWNTEDYMDEHEFFGFVWANGVRRALLKEEDQPPESNFLKFFREQRDYVKEVVF